MLHLFPTGRPTAGWHRRVLVGMTIWMATAAVLGLIAPGSVGFSGRPNALAIAPQWTDTLFDLSAIGMPIFGGLGLVILVLRRRRAGPVERAQLQWFFAGAAVFAAEILLAVLAPESSNRIVETALKVAAMLAFWSLPGAIVVALQSVLPGGASQVSVAASTLAVAGVFAPLRGAVQQRLDRHFNRARYELGALRRLFARRLQQQIDLETIEVDLLSVVSVTLEPGSVQLWLRSGSAPGAGELSRSEGLAGA